jgi:uncharacterized membrane protein
MVSQRENLNQPTQGRRKQLVPKPWRFLIVAVVAIGIFFRFANLDEKVYWLDEVINSIHSAGYSKQEFGEQAKAWKDKDITIEDLHKYQYPNSETSSLDVIRALAYGEPQSPPVYYLLSRWWTQLFGSSDTVQRSLSAFISLLAFPSMYWLCIELFGSSLAAWIGVILIAISPFHLVYAQEVRLYVLWTVTILVSSASLLRAIRLKRKRDWGIYAASLTLSLYTFPLSILVAIAHGIYVAIAEVPKFFKSIDRSRKARIKISKTFSNYLIASIASIVAYAPWIVFLAQIDETKMGTWRQTTLPFPDLFKYWLIQTSIIFADLNPKYRADIDSFYDPLSFYPMIFIWAIILYSLYFLVRHSPKSIWSFILPLILTTALAIALPDLIFGGRRSNVVRYLIPCYLGIELSIVNLISTKIYLQSITKILSRKIWQFILVIILSIGVISCVRISIVQSSWNKYHFFQNIPIAKIINSSEKPLIIGFRDSLGDLMAISHNLNNYVTIRLVDRPYIRDTDRVFSDKFLLNPPQEWLDLIRKENKFKVEEIYKGNAVEDPTSEANFRLVRIL